MKQIAGRFLIPLCAVIAVAGCTSAPEPGAGGLTYAPLAAPGYVDKEEGTKFLETVANRIQAHWYEILKDLKPAPPTGSFVIVTFNLHPDGRVEITKVDDQGAGKNGVWPAMSAITDLQPYPAWSPEMVAVEGKGKSLTLKFVYQ
jgi:hypothetical protein